MALRPGSRLLISSHFIPPPRSSIIKASSSGDHFDCFLAGGSATWGGRSRLPVTGAGGLVVGRTDAPGAGAAIVVTGADTGGSGLGGRVDDVVAGGASSSSSGFSSSEISTLAGDNTGWF